MYTTPPPSDPWGSPVIEPVNRGTDPWAIAALVCGIVSLPAMCLCYLSFGLAPAAIGMGLWSRRRCSEFGFEGATMAIAGVVCGAVSLVATIALVIGAYSFDWGIGG